MVMHEIFGEKRDIDISEIGFPTKEELDKLEKPFEGCEHGWFDSVVPNTKLHYRYLLPKDKKPKGIVIFRNGITGHSGAGFILKNGRKVAVALVAEILVKEGYAFYSYDPYGHGFSEGTRFLIPGSYTKDLDDYINFIDLVLAKHKADENNNIPKFIMGLSYGGTLTVLAAKHYEETKGPDYFTGVILLAPAIDADLPGFPVYHVLRYVLAPAFPKWTPFFMPNPVSADRTWKDKEVLECFTNPRYMAMRMDGSGKPFRLGTALQLVLAMEESQRICKDGLITTPYCVLHGDMDAGVPVSGSDHLWEYTKDKTKCKFHRIKDGYHDLMTEPTAEEYMKYITDWIKERIDDTTTTTKK